jgi:hypothetical protein
MLQLDPDVVAIVAVAAAAVALILLVVVVVLALKLRALRRAHQHAFREAGDDLVAVLGRHEEELRALRAGVDGAGAAGAELREMLRSAVCRIGIVRYDAFDDMGGALSFSAALLDERGDGVVLSAINGRSETRSYGKPVVGGVSEHHLTDEEAAAIEAAVERREPRVLPEAGRRRRRASS